MNQGKNTKKNKQYNKEFVVTSESGLLEFLLLEMSNKSRNNVKSLLTHKEVLVDGEIITKHDYMLKVGQKIQISPSLNRGEKKKDLVSIIYEDDDFIVINKPAGLLSIATDNERDITAYKLLTAYAKRTSPKGRVFVVHRLDRDTSGVLIVAKNEKMKLALQDNWEELVSKRCYFAIVEGKVQKKADRIQSWIKQTTTLLMYSSYKAGDGLLAITDYQVIGENAGYSLMDIQLETGRKNQIRVHMKDIGHCVVGDKKYGAKTDPLRRLGLHAYKLQFRHPVTNEIMCFEASPPKKFKALFKDSF
ncbi:MAG: RluA family pseudouridine synthase [Clostridia bacterium]|nr:RluA family pseudouridine synthase [Clostridia bacterium]